MRINQKQLAALCSIRPETLSRIETGKDEVPGYVEMILSLVERDEDALRFALTKAARAEARLVVEQIIGSHGEVVSP